MEIKTNNSWKDAIPLVPVITATRNRKVLLPRTFASVKSQTFNNFEYIAVMMVPPNI